MQHVLAEGNLNYYWRPQ